MRMPRVAIVLLAALFTTSACDLVDPYLAPGATPFTPPPVYTRWWSLVESCSGLSRSMNAVGFYVVRGATQVPLGEGGQAAAAYWSPAGNLIVLAEVAQLLGPQVRHEMLHALLQRTGHPREMFVQRCAGVLDCGPNCLDDAGPAPVPSALMPRVPPGHLELGVEVLPQAPRSSEEEGFFSITVTARNPSAEAVLVGGGGSQPTFSLQFFGPAGTFFRSSSAVAIESFVFGPGETKRQVYDFRIGPRDATGSAYPVGEYSMRGGYGDVRTPFRTLILAP